MGLCILYYVEYSLYNVKKVGFFISGLELHFKLYHESHNTNPCSPGFFYCSTSHNILPIPQLLSLVTRAGKLIRSNRKITWTQFFTKRQISNLSKLKAHTNSISNMAKMMEFVFVRLKTCGKKKILVTSIFFFSKMFLRFLSQG